MGRERKVCQGGKAVPGGLAGGSTVMRERWAESV